MDVEQEGEVLTDSITQAVLKGSPSFRMPGRRDLYPLERG
jgi:hypothetical protein